MDDVDPAIALAIELRNGARRAGIPESDNWDPEVRRSKRADFQANGVISLARGLGVAPAVLAEDIIKASNLGSLADTTVAPAGFINLTIHYDFLASKLDRLAGSLDPDRSPLGEKRTVIVDYSGPNVAKEMHVGHLRTTIIGDSLVRIHEWLGWRVLLENHLGDWGTPFGMLIEHMIDLGVSDAAKDLSQGDLTEFYRAARRKFDSSESFAGRARARVVLLQGGDEGTLDLWRQLVDASEAYFQAVYDLLGVRLDPSDYRGESYYNPMLADIVEQLEKRALLEISEGAKCVFPPGFYGRNGERLPLIVQKSDGGFGYAATDLAALYDRTQNQRADLIVYVVGQPQSEHLEMCFAVAREAGWLTEAETVHVAVGNVLDSDGTMLRTRAGKTVRLVDLLNEAAQRAEDILLDRGSALAATPHLARSVGIGAVKYADLSVDRVTSYVFETDRMVRFDGNTGPYLQYARVRALSVLAKGEAEPETTSLVFSVPEEKSLGIELLGCVTAIHDAAASFAPHRLAGQLYRIATAFTQFYESCPINTADGPTRAARRNLCDLTARTLACGLDLLGIAAPDRL